MKTTLLNKLLPCKILSYLYVLSPNVSTTPITSMGCQQCLPLSVVQLKGKHCRKPHCRNGVVDTFGHCLLTKKGLLNWYGPNVSTTPLQQWGFGQCLPFSWTTLRGKHCWDPIAVQARKGVDETHGRGVRFDIGLQMSSPKHKVNSN